MGNDDRIGSFTQELHERGQKALWDETGRPVLIEPFDSEGVGGTHTNLVFLAGRVCAAWVIWPCGEAGDPAVPQRTPFF